MNVSKVVLGSGAKSNKTGEDVVTVTIRLSTDEATSLNKALATVRECDVMDVMEEDERALCWDLVSELERVLK